MTSGDLPKVIVEDIKEYNKQEMNENRFWPNYLRIERHEGGGLYSIYLGETYLGIGQFPEIKTIINTVFRLKQAGHLIHVMK